MSSTDAAIISYLKTYEGKVSYNKFLINNKSLIVSELAGRPWKNQNSIWRKRFITTAEKIVGDKELIKQFQDEKTNECFWLEVENSQRLEIIKASQVKLKRKVDLQSVKIFDRSTSQQGDEILDLYVPPQKKLRYDNEADESEAVGDHESENIMVDTLRQNAQQFNLEGIREDIREDIRKDVCKEIREKIRKEIRNEIRDEIREEMYEICKEIRKEICKELRREFRKEIREAVKEINDQRNTCDRSLVVQNRTPSTTPSSYHHRKF
ncbi:hypothetical protein RCL2_002025900 [Rhizophagus clarus]|uniref:Uncharacterized protein n=1 Tax=Rhizophagus clarus TaxID=94130 RepID=A0A8H3QVK3_9GLOM|nr:hypothetical protein RCL2_002025900 [Rhizophagus clarus]